MQSTGNVCYRLVSSSNCDTHAARYILSAWMSSWNNRVVSGVRCHDDVIKWKIFRATGLLCREITGHRWIPQTKASDAALLCFPWGRQWFETPPLSLWRHCNATSFKFCWIFSYAGTSHALGSCGQCQAIGTTVPIQSNKIIYIFFNRFHWSQESSYDSFVSIMYQVAVIGMSLYHNSYIDAVYNRCLV